MANYGLVLRYDPPPYELLVKVPSYSTIMLNSSPSSSGGGRRSKLSGGKPPP